MTDYRNHFTMIGNARMPLETVEQRHCASHKLRNAGLRDAGVFIGDGTFNDDTGLRFTCEGKFLRQGGIDVEAELQRQQDEALNDERKLFVREAAVRLLATVDQSASERHGFACLMMKPCDAWSLAMQLWDSKPEDC